MFRAGIIAAIAIAAATAWALARMDRDIDTAFGDVPWLHPEMLGVRADAETNRAGRRTVGHRLSVMNANKTIQAKQFNSQSNSRIKSGRVGQ